MNRRDVLSGLVATCAVPLVSQRKKAGPQAKRFRPALGLNGFESSARKYGKTYPIWEILQFAADAGFEGIELVQGWPMGAYPPSSAGGRVSALKGLYDRYGLKIFSIQTFADRAYSPNDAERQQWLRDWTDQLMLAKSLGADCVGVWPIAGLGGQTVEEGIVRFAKSLKECGRIAAEQRMFLSVEIEPPFVFHQESHLEQILKLSDHPHVRGMYDTSHFDLMSGSLGKPHEMLDRIGVDKIGYVHLTDCDGTRRDGATSRHLPCGEGHVDIDASFRTLREGGFRGWVMIDAWEIPDPYDAATKGLQAIRRANELG